MPKIPMPKIPLPKIPMPKIPLLPTRRLHPEFAVLAGVLLSMMFLGARARADVATAAVESGDSSEGLSEITITAEKFSSTIQETPISISALSGDDLISEGITTVEEIARSVPGMSVRSAGPGLTEYDARGLASNGGAAPTVGFYLDEVPLSPPALSQSGKVVIDPGLYDIERVEVLRGPQGTLYGSGSMGGTVKLVTAQPKLDQFEGSAQVTGSETEGGAGNYSSNLMLNLPFGDMLALRLVGGDTYRSGWINLIAVNVPNAAATLLNGNQNAVYDAPVESETPRANYERLWNSRATLLFKPSDDLSVTLFAMDQRLKMGGYDLLDSTPTSSAPGTIYDAHYEVFPLPEPLYDDVQIYAGTVNANLGFADLTSATSYFTRENTQGEDASESLYYSNQGASPLVPVIYYEHDPSHQFAQEIRLTSHDVGGLHWVGGAFYSSLKSVWNEISASALNATESDPDGSYFTSWNPYWVKQFALFADGSYKLTDQWRLAAGVRWYEYHSQQNEFSWGLDAPYANQSVAPLQSTRASNKGFNPRINLSYEPSGDLNLYTTISKGFRPGGANQILPSGPPINCQPGVLAFGPDSAWNYEVGEKARMFDNRLTINSDFYYIRWLGIQQVITLPCGYQYYNNAGDGRAFGPELEIAAKLTNNWTLTLSGSYVDSKITSPSASFQSYLSTVATEPNGSTRPCPVTGPCTVPILNVAKDNVSSSLTYSTQVAPGWRLTARVDDQFVGPSTDVAYFFGYQLPSYDIANFHVILDHDSWSVNVFCENFTNEVALISANNTSFQFNIPQTVRYSTNQPRTYGTQLSVKF
jgi:outer membrane receptor protein involved in Fe transport